MRRGGKAAACIYAGRGQQGLAEALVGGKRCRVAIIQSGVADDAADQREAVRMGSRRRHAQQHVARRARRAGNHGVALDRAEGKAGQIIITIPVHARHFRRFAADQGAPRLAAAIGDS